jgi:hypothetical protein
MYKQLGAALCSALLTSEIVPAPIESEGEKVSPAKKRKMHRVHIFGEKPAPMVNSAPMGIENVYMMCLPYVSERGAAIMGPNPKANTYRVSGRRATVELTPKSFSMVGNAGVYIDDPSVLVSSVSWVL